MNQKNDEEALAMLREARCTVLEIERLTQLRRNYRIGELDQAHPNQARLEFARWLVQTGRLTDQIVEEDASSAPPLENKPILKMVIASMSLKSHQLGSSPSSDTWFYREYH
jgi:hypothetical protein